MVVRRALLAICVASGVPAIVPSLSAEVYPVIVRGKVTMQDGSPPSKPAGIQRRCDDAMGSAPGPVTDKKGEFVWRMDVDPMRVRTCRLEADLEGYISTAINISNLNGYNSTTVDLPPIVLRLRLPDPRRISMDDADVPSKSRPAWKAASKAVDSQNLLEAAKEFRAVAEGSPKFARGWHALGVICETLDMFAEARDAYRKAIEADSKSYASYVTLSKLLIQAKDWQAASTLAETLMKADSKQPFREIYLNHAIARFRLKDLDGAEASAKEALRPDQKQQVMRAEFVLGRISEARGNLEAARQHITKYIELDPGAADIAQIKAFLQVIGKPESAGVDPQLELP